MGKLVSIETAILAKKRGFLENTEDYYLLDYKFFKADGIPVKFKTGPRKIDGSQTHMASAMTLSDLQDWLRDKHDFHVEVTSHKYQIPQLATIPRSFRFHFNKTHSVSFGSYYEALEGGLALVLNTNDLWKKKK